MNAIYIISGLGFLALLAEVVNLKKWLAPVIYIGLLAALAMLSRDWNNPAYYFGDMLFIDNTSVLFTALIIVISVFWFWMSGEYFREQPHQTDRSALILFVVLGAMIMVSYNNMTTLFLGIEILSLSLYTLAGSKKESLLSNEASFKYFLMGAFATGFLLMGIALIYGATASFNITEIAGYLASGNLTLPAFFYTGMFLVLVGLAFKMSAVPFHFWAPDVYEGSPVAITAFMSTVVKIAAVAAFYKMFSFCFGSLQSSWIPALQVIAVLTLIVPNITAVVQKNTRRMLAYSSVGQVGYILLAIIAGNAASSGAILYYLAAYCFASIAAFSVLQKVEENHGFRGLAKRNPLLALVMTIALLSLAGIPPLPGFFGKYLVLSQALQSGYTGLVIVAVIASLISVYYYFMVILAMYTEEQEGVKFPISLSYKVLIVTVLLITVLAGLFPEQLIGLLA